MRRDVAVIGGGLAGLTAALAFAGAGFDVLLAAPEPPLDGRTTALFGRSVAFLQRHGLGPEVLAAGAPLRKMRIIDDTRRLLRAPSVTFEAAEIGLDVFGINIRNRDLTRILAERLVAEPRLTWLRSPLEALEAGDDCARLILADGTSHKAGLVIGADGRNSQVRTQSGLSLRQWSYPQAAIVLNFSHARPHEGISTEFHRRPGPFTLVPLPGNVSSLVWVERPEDVQGQLDAPPQTLSRVIEGRMHSILGKVEVEGSPQSFPLSGGRASALTAPRAALVGEAGHIFPPIGAQGLNLGLRDVEDLLSTALDHRDDVGGRTMLAAYARRRHGDITLRTASVDLLNRSLLADMLPAQMARSAGLGLLAALSPLRRFAMREGVVPGAGVRGLPKSLQGMPPRH